MTYNVYGGTLNLAQHPSYARTWAKFGVWHPSTLQGWSRRSFIKYAEGPRDATNHSCDANGLQTASSF